MLLSNIAIASTIANTAGTDMPIAIAAAAVPIIVVTPLAYLVVCVLFIYFIYYID